MAQSPRPRFWSPEIADTLYFEGPERRQKIASYIVMLVLSVAIASLAVLQDVGHLAGRGGPASTFASMSALREGGR